MGADGEGDATWDALVVRTLRTHRRKRMGAMGRCETRRSLPRQHGRKKQIENASERAMRRKATADLVSNSAAMITTGVSLSSKAPEKSPKDLYGGLGGASTPATHTHKHARAHQKRVRSSE
jgi:hypothetical protein